MMTSRSTPGAASRVGNSAQAVRIGINCLDVNPSFVGGVTTYALGLLEGFAAAATDCKFHAFVTKANEHLFEKFRDRDNFKVIVIDDPLLAVRGNVCRATLLSHSPLLYKISKDFTFDNIRELMDGESDVIYTPTPVLGYFNSRKPTVLSMHDVQHLHHPEFFGWARRLSRRITYDLSAKYASYLQASSEYIKQDLLRHFPWLSPEQIEVIPSGVIIEQFATPRASQSVAKRLGLPNRFLLFPAQLWPHKNHLTVLRALKRIETLHGMRIPLVLTGDRFSAAPSIFKFISDQSMDYVRHVGKVPFEDIVALYQKAAFMITATLHESSSLPILEAAAAGTPIIASRIPPIEELGYKLQLNLFDPMDVDALARLIVELWSNEHLVSAQIEHNSEHIKSYSWESTARKYIQLFSRITDS